MASCLDDENEIPLKVIASFSASRFALLLIPLIVLHSLVRSVIFVSKPRVWNLEDQTARLLTGNMSVRNDDVQVTRIHC